jgi:protein-S-isoprenylcysteine O-methyltransferase Ste14
MAGKTKTWYLFDVNPATPPVLTIDPGEEVTLEVRGAFADVKDVREVPTPFTPACDGHPLAPIAGPIHVRGADPGDAVIVELLRPLEDQHMLTDAMTATGRWFFRWRGYLPLVMLPLLLAGLWEFHYPYADHSLDLLREFGCLSLSMLGLSIRIATVGFVPKGTSGRGTKSMRAETLNTTGMYSIVRHPLYIGNALVFAGILLDLGSWSVLLIGFLAYWLYYERIMLAEEALLASIHGATFTQWAAGTPAIIPRLGRWKPPSLNFSARSALRREHTTLFMIICAFTAIEVAGDYFVHKRFEFDPLWQVIFLLNGVFYLIVRFIKKRTSLLDAPER